MAINLTDYKRTGIFIEERVTPLNPLNAPLAPNVHFVPGFSKKSTVFNRPLLITSGSQRKMYFGDIDRNLERKGSFFHRTIDIALQTAPVYAMNLLKTDENDTLEHASLSLTAQHFNKEVDEQRYDDFFNKAGFWQRDTESFLFFTNNKYNDDDAVLHLTNVSDKRMTFFIFKAEDPALEMTAEDWYAFNGEDRPLWIHPKSFISDYLIRVVAVAGDYTNYAQLSVDQTFGKYFNASGLRKEMVDDFIRELKVTRLADYTGSVIPYFRDLNGRNIFIESLINNETDRSGLFCAMDIDKIEADYNTGLIDLIGETLAPNDITGQDRQTDINFISYKEHIEETKTYNETGDIDNFLIKKLLYDFDIGVNGGVGVSLTSPILTFNPTTNQNPIGAELGYVNFNNEISDVHLSSQPDIDTTTGTAGNSRVIIWYVAEDSKIYKAEGAEYATGGIQQKPDYPSSAYVFLIAEVDYNTSDMNVVFYDTNNYLYQEAGVTQPNSTGSPFPVTMFTEIDTDLFIYYSVGPNDEIEGAIPYNGDSKMLYGSFLMKRIYDEFVNNIENKHAFIKLPNEKKYIDGAPNLIVSSTNMLPGNAFGELNISITHPELDSSNIPNIVNIGYTDKIIAPLNTGYKGYTTLGTANYAELGKDSILYNNFIDGVINSGDYFYESYGVMANDIIYDKRGFIILSIADAVTLNANIGSVNNGDFIIKYNNQDYVIDLGQGYDHSQGVDPIVDDLITDGILDATNYAFRVDSFYLENNKTFATTPDKPLEVLDYNKKVYLKMFSSSDDNVTIEFYGDNILTSPYILTIHANMSIHVYSGTDNYIQSLEIIDDAPGYVMTDTKFLIDLSRYNEVSINDFVLARTPDINDLEPGEMPKLFARIIKKTAWSGNAANGTSYAEITTDVKYGTIIDESGSGGPLQTLRFTHIDKYAKTYKGITLKGFKVQHHSIPDGTEVRMQEIMSVIEKDSPLYCAITNKQKFNFRYLVDSFGLGLSEFSKQTFADIVGKRKNAIAFLNAPSAKMFRQSTSPSFIKPDGTLDMEYVRRGGNQDQSPAFLYSFAQGSGKDDGRDCSAYFFPYVTVNDNGRPLSFPPAVYAANTYMRKNGSTLAGKYNFTVAAGVNDGLILGIANTEMDFTEGDYEEANTMGLNLISYHAQYGYYIETEYTAMTNPKTPISNLHVRELLIDMENEMYAMLFKYQYQFNIPTVRAKIKREADDICKKYYDRGGITYYENIIDESNNTGDLIDNQFGLLETTIVPVSAMAKLVNIFHVTTAGALSGASGFA